MQGNVLIEKLMQNERAGTRFVKCDSYIYIKIYKYKKKNVFPLSSDLEKNSSFYVDIKV